MTLKELLEARPDVEIKLAGQAFRVPVLSTFDLRVLERLYPPPSAPVREKFTGKGYAKPAPDETDPGYVAASADWFLMHDVRTVAVAMGEQLGLGWAWPVLDAAITDGVLKMCKEYIEAAVPLVGRLPWADIRAAAIRIRGVDLDPLKVAEGNSSSGAGAVPVPQPSGSPPSPAATS